MSIHKVLVLTTALVFLGGTQSPMLEAVAANTKIKEGLYKLINKNELCFDRALIERKSDFLNDEFLLSFGTKAMTKEHGDYLFKCTGSVKFFVSAMFNV
ncbi:MAG: hypothetical protein H6625_11285 [Bdellovibrionaceae bacterium]|nr:hypothetical protein [Pseudobdellovibrionaceae bacterium]